ncbi:MAG: hypothetical protein H7829_13455 [Magnetococcus sp. THC-1_WYH]
MVIDSDSIEKHIPYYLTKTQKEGLAKALSDFANCGARDVGFYIDKYPNEPLQGDGWAGLDVFSFENGARKRIKGIILSNTCDMSQENERTIPLKVVFAPVIRISKYTERLRESISSEEQIANKIRAIKNQEVTSMFYLPKSKTEGHDYIALLDDLHSIPAQNLKQEECKKIFTLSMFGFYLLLFKISVHFCRFHEGVNR